MNETIQTQTKTIGFQTPPPRPAPPPAYAEGFADRIRAEVTDRFGSALLRWLAMASVALLQLRHFNLPVLVQSAKEHPFLGLIAVVAFCAAFPFLAFIPKTMFQLEMLIFESLRRFSTLICGNRPITVFSLTLLLELFAIAWIVANARPQSVRSAHPTTMMYRARR